MHAKILAVSLAVPMTMGAMAPANASDEGIEPGVAPVAVAAAEPEIVEPEPTVAVEAVPESSVSPAPAAAPQRNAAASAKQAPRRFKGRSARAAGVVAMRARGTVYSPVKAASRLERWASHGVSGYHNQCLRLADNAYQPRGGRTGTALQQWSRAKRHGYGHPGNRRPPIGAQMFWRTSNPAGHIATYVGNGKAVTNMPGGRVKKINWRVMNKWGPYLGWAEPYYG